MVREGKRGALGAIFLTVFIDLVGFSVIFPLFPAMLRYYGEGAAEGSLLAGILGRLEAWGGGDAFLTTVLFGGALGSLYSLVQFVCSPLWGKLSDRLGRRSVLLLTISGTAASYALWAVSANFWLLVLARLLGGAMAGNLAVASAAIADVTTAEKRAKGMALIGVAFGLGFILGPVLGGVAAGTDLSGRFPGANPFSFAALLALGLSVLNLLWAWRVLPETRPEEEPAAAGERRTGLLERLAVRGSALRRLVVAWFLYLVVFAGAEFSVVFLAVERLSYAPAEIPRLFVVVGITMLLAQGWLARQYTRKLGEGRMAGMGILFTATGMGLLALAESTGLFYGGLVAFALGIGLATPAMTALASLQASETEQGADLGAFRAAGSLARAVGPFAGALAYWQLGSEVAYFGMAALMALPLVRLWR